MKKFIVFFIGCFFALMAIVFLTYEILLYRSGDEGHVFGGQEVLDSIYTIPGTYLDDPQDYGREVSDAITNLKKHGIDIFGHVESGDVDKRFSYFYEETTGSI